MFDPKDALTWAMILGQGTLTVLFVARWRNLRDAAQVTHLRKVIWRAVLFTSLGYSGMTLRRVTSMLLQEGGGGIFNTWDKVFLPFVITVCLVIGGAYLLMLLDSLTLPRRPK